MRTACAVVLLVTLAMLALPAAAFASDPVAEAPAVPVATPPAGFTDRGLLALGAGIAIGLAGLGTGIAQSRIGAAGIGAIAEKPESLGVVIILLAIPETVIILGFVVASIILFL